MQRTNTAPYLKVASITLAAILCVLIPQFIRSPYYLDMMIMVIVNAILAMTFVLMLRAGLISLGISAFWGIGAYASTILVMKLGLSFWLSLPAAAIITGVIALGLGYILLGRGGGGFTFVLLTSVIGMMFTVLVGSSPYCGGYSGISNIPPPNPIKIPFLPPIVFDSKAEYYYLALILLAVILLMLMVLYKGWIGRAWNAAGLSRRLAESIGVNVFSYRLLAFVVASVIAGLIGGFYAHYEMFIEPDSFAMWQNIYIQLYAVLGGLAYPILGPLLGAAVMTFVPGFLSIAGVIEPLIMGGILVLLVMFLPRGLLGLPQWGETVIENSSRIGKKVAFYYRLYLRR